MRTLAERFQASSGAPIDLDGERVLMLYEMPSLAGAWGCTISLRGDAARPQGLHLKARKGKIVVNEQELTEATLWVDSAPPVVPIAVIPDQDAVPANLRLWNQWRDRAGTTHAWVGNAGMVVRLGEDETVLRCSDGHGAARFTDLIATISLPVQR